MISFIIIDKYGIIKETNLRKLSRDELYKKCGYKNNDNFNNKAIWNVKLDNLTYKIELYAKESGRANSENKYDFPPPVDNKLFFGNCCLINIDIETNEIISLKSKTWQKIYEKLFGGFEDINEEEEYSEDELENIPSHLKTKNGYLKDGFVVEGDDINDINDEKELDDNDIDEISENEFDYHSTNSCENSDNEFEINKINDLKINDLKINDSYELGSELSEDEYDEE